jgi:lipoate-protein ligase A
MLRYIKSVNTDPHLNLALEQFVFDSLDPAFDYFMLWQNDNAIIIGKHQNTIEEINAEFVKAHDISVVRRLSGGGAVYHDLGNLNFTFITGTSDSAFDFALFCKPIVQALSEMGVHAEISGRNDMTIDGKKFSGNAQYMKGGRVMHHGTLMFDSNLEVVSQALNVAGDKIESKGIKSVRSRITNIKPYAAGSLSVNEFWAILEKSMFQKFDMREYTLTEPEWGAVKKLCDSVYNTWEWNYGRSPAFTLKKSRRVEGCGSVQVFLDVRAGAVIAGAEFYGDYFGNGNSAELAQKLTGIPLREQNLRSALDGVNVSHYFNNLDAEGLIAILMQ